MKSASGDNRIGGNDKVFLILVAILSVSITTCTVAPEFADAWRDVELRKIEAQSPAAVTPLRRFHERPD